LRVSIDHIVLKSINSLKLAEFYSEIFGFEILRLDEFLAKKPPFISLRLNEDSIIDIFEVKTLPKEQNLDHFCLSVTKEDFELILSKIESKNIEYKKASHLFGAKGYADSIYFRDLDRNKVEIRFY